MRQDNVVLLDIESSFDAYRADLAARPELRSVDEPASLWLLLEHCFQRIARVSSQDRETILEQCAQAFRPEAPGDAAGGADAAEVPDKSWPEAAAFADLFDGLGDDGGIDRLFDACLSVARDAAFRGAEYTAFTLLRSLRAAFPRASNALHARALVQQASIAERVGYRAEASRLSLEAEVVASL